ncbi:unnamed protein product [Arctogadus glacialis]
MEIFPQRPENVPLHLFRCAVYGVFCVVICGIKTEALCFLAITLQIPRLPRCLYCVQGPSLKWMVVTSGNLSRISLRMGSRCCHMAGGPFSLDADTVQKEVGQMPPPPPHIVNPSVQSGLLV